MTTAVNCGNRSSFGRPKLRAATSRQHCRTEAPAIESRRIDAIWTERNLPARSQPPGECRALCFPKKPSQILPLNTPTSCRIEEIIRESNRDTKCHPVQNRLDKLALDAGVHQPGMINIFTLGRKGSNHIHAALAAIRPEAAEHRGNERGTDRKPE